AGGTAGTLWSWGSSAFVSGPAQGETGVDVAAGFDRDQQHGGARSDPAFGEPGIEREQDGGGAGRADIGEVFDDPGLQQVVIGPRQSGFLEFAAEVVGVALG